MDMSQILPLLMMMNGGGAKAAGNAAAGASGGNAAPGLNYEDIIKNLGKKGGSPMDILQGMPGMGGMNPETLRMVKLFSEINNNKGKKGGVPQDMLFEMLGGSNPQFKQMKTMMDMMGKMNKPNNAPPPEATVQSSAAASHSPPPINDLNPIKTIAPDAIYRSMREYIKNRNV